MSILHDLGIRNVFLPFQIKIGIVENIKNDYRNQQTVINTTS